MDPSNSNAGPSHSSFQRDRTFEQEVERLHQLTVLARWLLVVGLWVVLGLPSLWALRFEIELWREYFTWTAVRYTLAYNTPLSIALSLCIGSTIAVLIWQSRNILAGLPEPEQHRLEQQVMQIRRQGPSHPLWTWVIEGKRRWRP
jgi:hypothetical protein